MNRILWMLLLLGVAGGAAQMYTRYNAEQELLQAAADAKVLPDRNVIDVYGRPGCAYTSGMLADLEQAGVPIRFHNIDYPYKQAAFQERFAGSGLATERGYALPIIAVAGQQLARPQSSSVLYAYRNR